MKSLWKLASINRLSRQGNNYLSSHISIKLSGLVFSCIYAGWVAGRSNYGSVFVWADPSVLMSCRVLGIDTPASFDNSQVNLCRDIWQLLMFLSWGKVDFINISLWSQEKNVFLCFNKVWCHIQKRQYCHCAPAVGCTFTSRNSSSC